MKQEQKERGIATLYDADGKVRGYRAVTEVGTDPATGKRKQVRTTHRTIKEARAWLAETQADVRRGTYSTPVKLQFGDWARSWLAGRVNLRPSTRLGYEGALAVWIDELGAVPLQQLTREHLESVRDRMLSGELRRAYVRPPTGVESATAGTRRGGAPLSPRTVTQGLGLVQQVLDAAERDGKIPRNPARHVERPEADAKEGQAWTEEQVAAFEAVAGEQRLAAAWMLTMLGLRRGEVLGLRWEDIDLEVGVVSIRVARVVAGGLPVPSKLKTKNSRRDLPLTTEQRQSLVDLQELQRAERITIGETYLDTGLLVVDEAGVPVSPSWYSDEFARLSRRAGVPPIRLHDARHTSVSRMRARGLPDHIVASFHGHDETVMRGVYTHVTVADLRRSLEIM